MIICLCSALTLAASADNDPYRAVLSDRNPGFEVIGPIARSDGSGGWEGGRDHRYSPESFRDDILIGDFNFDGLADFAAALVENRPGDANLGRAPINGFTAVCSGRQSDDESQKFECKVLAEGLNAYIYLMDFTPSLDLLLDREPVPDNPVCSAFLNAHLGQELLAIPEHYGRCDTFYYPKSDLEYGGCRYCAD